MNSVIVRLIEEQLSKINGFDDLDEQQKQLIIVLAGIKIACISLDWIATHKEDIKSWIK